MGRPTPPTRLEELKQLGTGAGSLFRAEAIDNGMLGQPAVLVSFMFEKLKVYQRAIDLAERVTGITKVFPPQGYHHLADQLRRASLSISLNIAEGNGRWHVKDRKNFFWIARGSVFECVPLTELCKREKLITENTRGELKAELQVLSKMLTALINGTDRRDN